MHHDQLIGLAAVIVLGVSAQWLASVLRLPAILLLLLAGIVAGPVAGVVDTEALLGDLLFPLVSLSVAVILFEGGMSLHLRELKDVGRVVPRLILVGAAVSWLISAAAAHYLLGLSRGIALLLGAILVVTGPTVIGPLLRQVRPRGSVGSILKWEGIVIDPVGATLAVLVYEAVVAGSGQAPVAHTALSLFKTIAFGGGIGAACAGLMILLLRRYWVPEYLQNVVTLMLVVIASAGSDMIQSESGLLAVTVMGIILGNQKGLPVVHILEFKENLGVLIIGSLFVLLGARLEMSTLLSIDLRIIGFLLVLLLVARPVSVMLSTWGSRLSRRERIFLAAVAPRGIVAAAVSSVFALRLTEQGFAEGEQLIDYAFLAIIATVAVYGVMAAPVARWLGLARPSVQGMLIVGAHPWARRIAAAVHEAGFRVHLVDTNRANILSAHMEGLVDAEEASILSERYRDEVDLNGIGRLVALTPNEQVNSLASLHFAHVFGRSQVYQLPTEREPSQRRDSVSEHLRGRDLFGAWATFDELDRLFAEGADVKMTPLTKEFDLEAYRKLYGDRSRGLFLVTENRDLMVFTAKNQPTPRPGQKLISLILPVQPEETFEPEADVKDADTGPEPEKVTDQPHDLAT